MKHIITNGAVTEFADDLSELAVPLLPSKLDDLLQAQIVQTGLLETILLRLDKLIGDTALTEAARLKTEDAPPNE